MSRRIHTGAAAAFAFAAALCAGTAAAMTDGIMSDGFEGATAGPRSDEEAARFLHQATFAPTLADIQHLRQLGYSAWLDEQFALPLMREYPYLQWAKSNGETVYHPLRLEAWWLAVLGGVDPSNTALVHKDQLRQKMAYALSQIFVISDVNEGISTIGATSYYDTLQKNAFGNYRALLQDVTLHPAMGIYLSMLRNRKPDPILNIRPDENYAREIMQLFSIGLSQLNADGTLILQNGQPIPTYTQTTVRGFASVFTGWNWAGCNGWEFCYPGDFDPHDDEGGWFQPLAPVAAYHDSTGPDFDAALGKHYKQLLSYSNLPVAQTRILEGGAAASEMQFALDNVFNHPNVAPFICKQLIQRFVTSNPSPAYVARVAGTFGNNGQNVRGDLKAVLKAILLDPEARYGQRGANAASYGKAREPIIRFIQLLRVTDSHAANGRYDMPYPDFDYYQAPLRAPSVFNFYKPDHHPTGEVTQLGLVAPEFQIMNDAQVTSQTNDIGHRLIYGHTNGAPGNTQILINLDGDAALAANASALLDKYDLLFLSGQMSASMRQVLLTDLNQINAGTQAGKQARLQDALYLILNSPEYLIQK